MPPSLLTMTRRTPDTLRDPFPDGVHHRMRREHGAFLPSVKYSLMVWERAVLP